MTKAGAEGKPFYSRRRISKLLYGVLNAPLTLVMAQFGFEKTENLMAFLGRRKDIGVIRFSFARSCGSDALLWAGFCRAAAAVNPKLSEELLADGLAQDDAQRHRTASRLRERLEGLNVLVLEAFEDCSSASFEKLIVSLAQLRLTSLNIVVLSRKRPCFMLDGFFSGENCDVIDQQDLAYTPEEVQQYFQAYGCTLTESELGRAAEIADGWPAAVRMLREEYERTGLVRQTGEIVDLMREFCLERLNLPDQKLLAYLSVLDSFSVEQAEYVTENRKTKYQLIQLYENNCFLIRDADHGYFRIHPIMRAAAHRKLELLANDLEQFYLRCARWHDIRGEKLSALHFYRHTGNEVWLCALLAQPYAAEVVDQDPVLIREALPALTMRMKQKYREAALANCYALLVYYNREEGMRELSALQSGYTEGSVRRSNRNQILGEAAMLESLAYPEDLEKTEALYKAASQNFGGGYSGIFSQRNAGVFGSPSILWRYHMRPGSMKETAARIGELHRGTAVFRDGAAAAAGYLAQAEYAYNTGNLTRAEEQACLALIHGRAKGQDGIQAAALFTLGRSSAIRGDNESMVPYQEELRRLSAKEPRAMLPGAGAAVSYLSACLGPLEPLDTDCMVPIFNNFIMKIVEGKRLLQQKAGIQLELFAENMLYEPGAGVFARIYGGIYLAAAKERLGEISEADKVLDRAILLAAADEIVMPFVENAPYILPVLVRSAHPAASALREKAEEFQRNYYQFLLQNGEYSLSKTELQIIRWYAVGCKQSEVARNLNLSVTATRRAINDIYRKIGIADITRIAEMVLR